MRIGIGAVSNYPGPVPVTLLTGENIADPGTTQATEADCLPYQCGEDPENTAALFWCAFWGQSRARACTDPACGPYQQACVFQAPAAKATMNAAVTPAVQAAVQSTAPSYAPARLTPQNIVQAMPDITLALAPVPVQSCDAWLEVNGWISDNPLLAAAILAGTFVIAWRQSGRR